MAMGFYLPLPDYHYNCVSPLLLEAVEVAEMDNMGGDPILFLHVIPIFV